MRSFTADYSTEALLRFTLGRENSSSDDLSTISRQSLGTGFFIVMTSDRHSKGLELAAFRLTN